MRNANDLETADRSLAESVAAESVMSRHLLVSGLWLKSRGSHKRHF